MKLCLHILNLNMIPACAKSQCFSFLIIIVFFFSRLLLLLDLIGTFNCGFYYFRVYSDALPMCTFCKLVYQDIMDYVQSGEILYIPGAMTPTEVSVNFWVHAVDILMIYSCDIVHCNFSSIHDSFDHLINDHCLQCRYCLHMTRVLKWSRYAFPCSFILPC